MHAKPNHTLSDSPARHTLQFSAEWLRAAVLLFALAALAPAAGVCQGPPSGASGQVPLTNPQPHPNSIILPEANRTPDANEIMEMRSRKAKNANFEAANIERKRQLMEDSAMLLKLAAELKAEVDKTPSDMLSLGLMRKADDIERLAHIVQAKMKLTVGAE
ncbi:MAG TPA: hypothetical protein VKB38_06500 [Terracidiphilus sp.]|nr:hypothetical protein [Terracidiphilus sp.]